MKLEQFISNYKDYHIMVFPKGRVNKPVKYVDKFYDREVNDFVLYESIKVILIYVD